jgi:3',5'-cyclic AMP phosphodiesterase CpdA
MNMAKHRIIHLSDIHIGCTKNELKHFRRVIGSISKHYAGATVLITGDITDSATKGQMSRARKQLDRLAQTNPVLVVPGNHDYAWKGNVLRKSAWKNWVDMLGEPLGIKNQAPTKWMTPESSVARTDGLGIVKVGNIAFFGIDSGDPRGKVGSARGYISKGLARALKKQLADHKNMIRVAFLHHHPFTHGLFTGLTGTGRLMDALRSNCEILLFGHEHRLGLWWTWHNEIHLVAASHKSTAKVFGDHLMITVIEINKVGNKPPTFWHRLELV